MSRATRREALRQWRRIGRQRRAEPCRLAQQGLRHPDAEVAASAAAWSADVRPWWRTSSQVGAALAMAVVLGLGAVLHDAFLLVTAAVGLLAVLQIALEARVARLLRAVYAP